jgi:hypothetical protein
MIMIVGMIMTMAATVALLGKDLLGVLALFRQLIALVLGVYPVLGDRGGGVGHGNALHHCHALLFVSLGAGLQKNIYLLWTSRQ